MADPAEAHDAVALVIAVVFHWDRRFQGFVATPHVRGVLPMMTRAELAACELIFWEHVRKDSTWTAASQAAGVHRTRSLTCPLASVSR